MQPTIVSARVPDKQAGPWYSSSSRVEWSNYGKVSYSRTQHVGHSGAWTCNLWTTSQYLYPLHHTWPIDLFLVKYSFVHIVILSNLLKLKFDFWWLLYFIHFPHTVDLIHATSNLVDKILDVDEEILMDWANSTFIQAIAEAMKQVR